MPRPPTARGAIAKRVSYVFQRLAIERPPQRAQRCQCGYWVHQVPCTVCREKRPHQQEETPHVD